MVEVNFGKTVYNKCFDLQRIKKYHKAYKYLETL
jgi:hypothetical protein